LRKSWKAEGKSLRASGPPVFTFSLQPISTSSSYSSLALFFLAATEGALIWPRLRALPMAISRRWVFCSVFLTICGGCGGCVVG
jgi:hypothetical protein